MTIDEYYTPPSDAIFEDIKQAAIALWSTYDDSYGYATGKINRIKDIENVQDNHAYMVAMFDHVNQDKLLLLLKTNEGVAHVLKLLDLSRQL